MRKAYKMDTQKTRKPYKKKVLSESHRRKIGLAMEGNTNKGARKDRGPYYALNDRGELVLHKPAREVKRRKPMSQETKNKIAAAMKDNKNGMKR